MASVYTDEETAMMLEKYKAASCAEREDVVLELAEVLGKPKKSIIGKLSKEGVYKKKEYQTKQGNPPKLKKETIAEIAELLDADIEKLQGLTKTSKLDLEYLHEAIRSKYEDT